MQKVEKYLLKAFVHREKSANFATCSTMDQQEFTRASPERPEGFSIARRVLADVAAFYIDNGGPALARQHVESVAHELIIYSDCTEAYREALAYIRERELADERKAEEHSLQQQRELIMVLMGDTQAQRAKPPTGRRPRDGTGPKRLPPELSTDKAMRIWTKLQAAGYIDGNYQPVGLSRTEIAVMADVLSIELKTESRWKAFVTLWGREDLRIDYNRAINQDKTHAFRDKLKAIITI
ncbi:MAG: hypothetical protein II864_12720 [Prevotella sp.]|nr:hypothetical protein [Prevotella sp.]